MERVPWSVEQTVQLEGGNEHKEGSYRVEQADDGDGDGDAEVEGA